MKTEYTDKEIRAHLKTLPKHLNHNEALYRALDNLSLPYNALNIKRVNDILWER